MDKIKKQTQTQKKKVEGRTSLYNPLLQKPVALHPVGPGSYPAGYGGYAYIGPPPDFGGTYGKFQDTAGREQYGIKSSKMFSIYDGSPTQFHAELSEEEREALLSQMDQVVAEYKCEHCRSQLAVSVGKKMDNVFCPHCGSEMAGAAEKVKQCVSKIEEIQMSTKSTIEAKAKRAKSTVDIAKEAMKKEHPAKLNEKVAPKAAEVNDLKEAQKGIEKKEPMKELAKDMVKAEADKKAEILAKKKERMKAAVKAYIEKKKTEKVKAAKTTAKAAPVKAELTAEQKKLRRELRVMAAFEPAKFAEVKKNAKLSAICAEVEGKVVSKADRIKVRAELAVLAAEDALAAEELTKQLDFIAPEILMEEKIEVPSEEKKAEGEEGKEDKAAEACGEEAAGEHPEHATVSADEAAKAPEKTEEEKKAEAELPAAEELVDDSALSMQTEFLASLDKLKGEIVEMSLYDTQSENPFWNVTVDGTPVGRVYLQDQVGENPESIRAAFCTDSYSTHFGEAARSVGLKRLLTITKAKLFAHQMDDTEVTARIREKVKAEVKAEMDEKLTTLRSDFLNAASLAMVAADKNFYQEGEGHALKEGLFNSLVQAGLNEEGAVWAIESGFQAATEYFNFIMAKAQEIMDMPSQAREAIEKQILASGKMQIKVEQPEEETVAARLLKSSVNALAMGEMVSGENREKIRSQLKLNAHRR